MRIRRSSPVTGWGSPPTAPVPGSRGVTREPRVSGRCGSVPLPACEAAEGDQPAEDNDQPDPEAPEDDCENSEEHDDPADRDAGYTPAFAHEPSLRVGCASRHSNATGCGYLADALPREAGRLPLRSERQLHGGGGVEASPAELVVPGVAARALLEDVRDLPDGQAGVDAPQTSAATPATSGAANEVPLAQP